MFNRSARLTFILLTALAAWADSPTASRCPAGMVLVAAGQFQFGPAGESKDDPDYAPASQQSVAAFCLDAREVTVAAFGKTTQNGNCPPQTDARRSINCVSYTQAAAHCASRAARLPTEIEWEFAARGPKSWPYPWGPKPVLFTPLRPNLCILRQERTGSLGPCAPGSSPADRTPNGIFDLAYNLSEWTSTLAQERRVIRGGDWTLRDIVPVTTQRTAHEESYINTSVGFRCAAGPK